MSENNTSLYPVADEFIHLANRMAEDGDRSTVGMAIRYAAARYNTFEVSTAGYDLVAERQKIIDMLCDDFRRMLEENIEDYAKQVV